MLRLVLQATHEMYHVEWPGIVQAFVDINWLYFSFLLFVFTCVLIFAVSAVTPKAPPEQLAGPDLRLGHARSRMPPPRRVSDSGRSFTPGVILAIIAGIYIYFW
jgi:hypothetical protein